MALEPSSIQRDRMLANGKNKLTLVQFLVMKDVNTVKNISGSPTRWSRKKKVPRSISCRIDQLITAGEMPYQYLTVDSFPSSLALLLAHENSREIRHGIPQ